MQLSTSRDKEIDRVLTGVTEDAHVSINYPNASLVQRYSRQMLVPQMDGMSGQLALESSRGKETVNLSLPPLDFT